MQLTNTQVLLGLQAVQELHSVTGQDRLVSSQVCQN